MPNLGLGLGLGLMKAGGAGVLGFSASIWNGTKDVTSTAVGEKIASVNSKIKVDNSGGSATTVIGFGNTLHDALLATSETIGIGDTTIIDATGTYVAWSSSETKTNVITQGN